MIHQWSDFNDAVDAVSTTESQSSMTVEAIKAELLHRLPQVLTYLLPAVKQRHHQFMVGDISGSPGKSLVIEGQGERAGMWVDFATGEGGDLLALWAAVHQWDTRRDFTALMKSIEAWLQNNAPNLTKQSLQKVPTEPDELGPATQKWDYYNAQAELIACVYRHETEDGKEFRPWDVKNRRRRAPDPRPLYNQPAIAHADEVVLVEGEKAADALIQQGIVATTAMNGANAPIDKTDWMPLIGKKVVIWPDQDKPGKEYARKVANALCQLSTQSISILQIPETKPDKWDAHDAVTDGLNISSFIKKVPFQRIKEKPSMTAYLAGDYMEDKSPMPEDLIAPRVLTPGGMVVFGGAAKVGKSDFLLSWLMHMAAGAPFLELTPTRPLRIFYLQAEVQYDYMRERIQSMTLTPTVAQIAANNLWITPQLRLIFNDEGTQEAIDTIQSLTEGNVDVIVIDPIRNVFDGGEQGSSENDNNSMLFFLRERVERIRNAVNPKAGLILVHHTKKMAKKQIEEDPFLAISGAGSLRGYYTTGMVLYKQDEEKSERNLVFELRNGPKLTKKCIDKKDNRWVEMNPNLERLINQDYGAKLDAERLRKQEVILQILFDEAEQGRLYSLNQFAETYEGKAGLGAKRTINERLAVHATKGHIKFLRETESYGLPPLVRSKYGYLCVESMHIPAPEEYQQDTEDFGQVFLSIKPTHYKCAQTGAVLPVENPDIWVYQEDI